MLLTLACYALLVAEPLRTPMFSRPTNVAEVSDTPAPAWPSYQVAVLRAPAVAEPLPPAFTLAPKEVAKALWRGKETARKKRDWKKLCDPYTAKLAWVGDAAKARYDERYHRIDPNRVLRDSRVYCESLGGTALALNAFDAAKSGAGPLDAASLETTGAEISELAFYVHLASVPDPGRDWWWSIRIPAAEGDTKATRFTLLDDAGHEVESLPGATDGSHHEGEMVFDGPVQTLRPASYSPGGPNENSGSWDVRPVMERVRAPFYEGNYRVAFPVRTPDGRSSFSATTRTLTLRIFTTHGEQKAVFHLPARRR